MNLVKDNWSKLDIEEFQKYLEGFAKVDRIEWTKKIINTNLPCLAIPTSIIKNIAREISKGDFISFLENNVAFTYDNFAITGFLIPKITDFELMKKHLWDYVNKIDNWAHCDLLKFKVNKGNCDNFLSLAKEFVSSDKTFVKRVGLIILFNFLDNDHIDDVLNICNGFYNEKEYYVNMCVAWLLCEAFIKQRESVLQFLQHHNLNAFTINKFVSKCRDSYRVSTQDKNMLLQLKKKKDS